MARRILNRRELREESDAAERLEEHDELEELEDEEVEEVEEEEDDEPVKPVKKPVKRKSRAKVAKEVRLKAFWGVFSQSMTQVATFEYSQRKQADAKAKELSESKKSPHFVQLVKKVIEE
jgi:hypothetical protein